MLHALVFLWVIATVSLAGLLSLLIALQGLSHGVARVLRAAPRVTVTEKRPAEAR